MLLPKYYQNIQHLIICCLVDSYSNTKSTVVRNPTVLSSTTDQINLISNHVWNRWRHCSKFMWDTTSIKFKYKLSKKYVVLVYDEKVHRHFWRIAIVTEILPSRDSEKKGAIVRIKKANVILKRPVNKRFTTEYTNHDTN